MSNKKKVIITSAFLTTAALAGVVGGVTYLNTVGTTSADQQLNQLGESLLVNVKTSSATLNDLEQINSNELTLSVGNETKDLHPEAIFWDKYKVALKSILPSDKNASPEAVLVIENVVDTKSKIEVVKSISNTPVDLSSKNRRVSRAILANSSPELEAEFKKITSFTFTRKSGFANKFPRDVTDQELNKKGNIQVSSRGNNYNLPEGYKINYQIQTEISNNSIGIAVVRVTLSKDDLEYSILVNIIGFATKLSTSKSIDVTVNTEVTGSSFVLPSQLLDEKGNIDSSKINIVVDDGRNIVAEEFINYYISYSDVKSDDKTGSLSFDVTFVHKADFNITKKFQNISINGLASGNNLIGVEVKKELDKITNLELKSDSDLVNKLPSELTNEDLTNSNLVVKNGDNIYNKADGYDVKYEIVSGSVNDIDGTIKVKVTITKDGVSQSKELTLSGLKTKLDNVEQTDVSIKLTEGTQKEVTTPSDLLKADGSVDESKLEVIVAGNKLTAKELKDHYDIKISPKYSNDATGVSGFDITITPKNNSSKAKTFENVELPNLKRVTLTESLTSDNVSLKESQKDKVTIAQIKKVLDQASSQADKFAKLKEYFDVSLPKGVVLKEVVSFNPKGDSTSEAQLSYKLAKENVKAGTASNPNATEEVVSEVQTLELSGFASASSLAQKELDKVDESNFVLSLTSSAPKANTLPSQLLKNDGSVDESKLVLNGNDSFNLDDYTVSYSKNWVNDANGEASFEVKLTSKAHPEVSKTFDGQKLTGMKTYQVEANLDATTLTLKANKAITTIADLKEELDKLTDQRAKVAKFKEYVNVSLPEGVDLLSIESFTQQGESKSSAQLAYKLTKAGVANGSDDKKDATTSVVSDVKTVTINGFTTENTLLSAQLDKIKDLDLVAGSELANKLPSNVNETDLNNSSLTLKNLDGSDYQVPHDYQVKYRLSKDSDAVNDVDGTLKVTVIITKDGVSESKDVVLTGLKTKLDSLNKDQLSVSANDSTTTLASEFKFLADGSNLNLSTSSSVLTTADLEKYNVSYQVQWVNDVTGEVGLKVVLTSKTNKEKTKTFENVVVKNFKKASVEESLSSASLVLKADKKQTTVKELKAALESATDKVATLNQYFDLTLPKGTKLAEVVSVEPKEGSNTVGTLTYKLTKENVKAGIATNPTQVGSITSKNKTVDLNNLATDAAIIAQELAKVTGLELTNNSSLKEKLPTSLQNSDLTSTNLQLKVNSGNYSSDQGYKVSYSLATPANLNDGKGTVDVKVTLTKDGNSADKTFTLNGLKTEISALSQTNLTPSYANATATLPSAIDFNDTSKWSLTSNSPELTTTELENYTIVYKKAWVNDVEGKVGVDVNLTLKSGSLVTKTFTNLELSGFKKATVEQKLVSTSFSFKENKENTTIQELKAVVMAQTSAAQKVAKLKEYFNVVIPAGHSLTDISSLEAKIGTNNSITIGYVLSKENVANGTALDKVAKATISASFSVDVNNLKNEADNLTEQLAKINALSLTASSELKTIFASRATNDQLNATNLQPKISDQNYNIPSGYTLSYSLVTPQNGDNLSGNLKVVVKLAKNGIEKVKELTVSGLKTLAAEHLTLTTKSSVEKSDLLASELAAHPGELPEKLATTVTKASGLENSELEKYNLSYRVLKTNDIDGVSTIALTLQAKNNLKLNKTFNLELKGLKKALEDLEQSQVKLTATSNKLMASQLLKSDGSVDSTKLRFATTSIALPTIDLNKYTVEYTKVGINDVDGIATFDVKFTSKSNKDDTKTFKNVQVTGLKPYTVTASLNSSNFKLKAEKSQTTVGKLKQELAKVSGDVAKVAKFKEYVDVTLPQGIVLTKIESLEYNNQEETQGILQYQVSQNVVKDGTTVLVASKTQSVKVLGFQDPTALLGAQMAKITSLAMTSSSTLKSKLPSAITNNELTTTNIELKAGDKVLNLPEGFKVSYTLAKNPQKSDLNGSLVVTVNISSDEHLPLTKDFLLKGFNNKLLQMQESDLSLQANSAQGLVNGVITPSSLLNVDGSVKGSQLEVVIEGISRQELNQFSASYKKVWVNDIEGNAGFDVTLTSKQDPTITRTFKDVTMTEMQKFAFNNNVLTSSSFEFKEQGLNRPTVAKLNNDIHLANTTETKVAALTKDLKVSLPTNYQLLSVNGVSSASVSGTLGQIQYQLQYNNVANGSKENPDATKTVKSEQLTTKVQGFRPAHDVQSEIAKVAKIVARPGSRLANKNITEIKGADLQVSDIVAYNADGSVYQLPENFKIHYSSAQQLGYDEHTGAIKVKVTIYRADNPRENSSSQDMWLLGFGRKIDTLTGGMVQPESYYHNSNYYASYNLSDEDETKGDPAKFGIKILKWSAEDIAKYDFEYEIKLVNDIEGILIYNVKMSLKTDKTITRTFTSYTERKYGAYEYPKEIGPFQWKWRDGPNKITLAQMQRVHDAPYLQKDRDAAVSSYFDFGLPKNVVLVNVRFKPKYESWTVGVLSYQLANYKVYAGTSKDPFRKVEFSDTTTHNIEINGFLNSPNSNS